MDIIIPSNGSIRDQVDEIASRLSSLTEEEKVRIGNRIKGIVQSEAEIALDSSGYWGCVYAATGVGKSKIPIDILYTEADASHKVLLVVPTEKLRDEGWREEFQKWELVQIYDKIVQRVCYASLASIEGQTFDWVILDEVHNITDNNSEFFDKNTVKHCIGLSATPPKDALKKQILRELKLNSVYELSLDQAVKLGITAPYDITIITMRLDDTKKVYKAGAKGKEFLQTEKERYNYLTRICFGAPNKFNFLNRMNFVYNLESKKEVGRLILEHVIPKELQTLIFCGSIDQAIDVCERRYYSRPSAPKEINPKTNRKTKDYNVKLAKYEKAMKHWEGDAALNAFKLGVIERLSCCEALNEGQNIHCIDVELIIQLNASDKDLIQRMGRALRIREDHIGKVIILCVEDTVDADWVKKATKDLDQRNIRRVELSRLRMEIEKIEF